jgi:hypothetical protein
MAGIAEEKKYFKRSRAIGVINPKKQLILCKAELVKQTGIDLIDQLIITEIEYSLSEKLRELYYIH